MFEEKSIALYFLSYSLKMTVLVALKYVPNPTKAPGYDANS